MGVKSSDIYRSGRHAFNLAGNNRTRLLLKRQVICQRLRRGKRGPRGGRGACVSSWPRSRASSSRLVDCRVSLDSRAHGEACGFSSPARSSVLLYRWVSDMNPHPLHHSSPAQRSTMSLSTTGCPLNAPSRSESMQSLLRLRQTPSEYQCSAANAPSSNRGSIRPATISR